MAWKKKALGSVVARPRSIRKLTPRIPGAQRPPINPPGGIALQPGQVTPLANLRKLNNGILPVQA
jgi:hypothetical protein